jgi:hypothetical protein
VPDIPPAEPPPGRRGLVDYHLASHSSRLPYDGLSDLGKALIALGLLASLLIIAGQTARWFYKGVWPTERVSLVWDALSLPRLSARWMGVQTILELWLALPLWFGVMCFLVIAGYTLRMAANVLRRWTPR